MTTSDQRRLRRPARRYIPKRRWPRRVLIGANVLAALAIITVAGGYAYTRWRLDSIHTVAAPHLTPTHSTTINGKPDTAAGLPAENILLIGNETRAGLNPNETQFGNPQLLSGALSDVIMILHLDPVTREAAILSIPRDLFLPMPPNSPVGPYQKIDAALNDGVNGPDNLIQAITDDLGIPINHYIELNFDGFQATVNAIGGINVDFPEPVFDAESNLNITTTGCLHLNGTQALALVRSRHLQYDPPGVSVDAKADWPYDPESDLSRIVRDHTFLRILASTAESKGLSNPLTANALIGAVINQITIDPGLKGQLLSLISNYHNLNPATAPETTLPVTSVNNYSYNGADIGDIDLPVQPLDDQVIANWDDTALPAAVAPTAVEVSNIAGVYNLATTTAAGLSANGLHVSAIGDGTVPAQPTETLIHYSPGQVAQALAVMAKLSGAVMLESDASVAPGTVVVDVGSLTAVNPPPTATATAPAPTAPGTPSATTGGTTAPSTPATTVTTVPTPDGQTPSSAADVLTPWDPRPCT
jgi:LCP family protein required for cell wall assembly